MEILTTKSFKNSMNLKVSLDQWQALVTIAQEGSYAKASLKLHKSQPTLSYLMKKMEETLGIALFAPSGRTVTLTSFGKEYYYHALKLLEMAEKMEAMPALDSKPMEAEIRLVVDEIYPIPLLMSALSAFDSYKLPTQISLKRSILSGPLQAFKNNQADIAISFNYPKDYLGEHLITVTSSLYAAENHPLHCIDGCISEKHLKQYRQIIVRDANQEQSIDVGFLSPVNAWYVDTLEMKLQYLNQGLGYAWLNDSLVNARQTQLRLLHLEEKSIRYHDLYLVYGDLGPAGNLLVKCLRQP